MVAAWDMSILTVARTLPIGLITLLDGVMLGDLLDFVPAQNEDLLTTCPAITLRHCTFTSSLNCEFLRLPVSSQ